MVHEPAARQKPKRRNVRGRVEGCRLTPKKTTPRGGIGGRDIERGSNIFPRGIPATAPRRNHPRPNADGDLGERGRARGSARTRREPERRGRNRTRGRRSRREGKGETPTGRPMGGTPRRHAGKMGRSGARAPRAAAEEKAQRERAASNAARNRLRGLWAVLGGIWGGFGWDLGWFWVGFWGGFSWS